MRTSAVRIPGLGHVRSGYGRVPWFPATDLGEACRRETGDPPEPRNKTGPVLLAEPAPPIETFSAYEAWVSVPLPESRGGGGVAVEVRTRDRPKRSFIRRKGVSNHRKLASAIPTVVAA